jgi:5-methyltetrahydrofolate--homocysteine methyltransferase
VVDGKAVYDCTPEEFTAYVEEMAECGVCLFGGCCGTEAEHIGALAKAVSGLKTEPVSPAEPDKLPCATEKQVFLLDVTAGYGNVLPCDEDLEDALFDEMEEDADMIAIRIESEDELDTFADCQGMIGKPLCILCEDAALLEKVLRLYQGRAVYEGSLTDEQLMPLMEKYGLIL